MIDRRTFLHNVGLAGLSTLAFSLGANRASADPDPPANPNEPALLIPAEPDIFSFRFGDMDAFVILDGVLTFPNIQPVFVPEAKPEEIQALLRKNFLPVDQLSLSLNVLVLKAHTGVMLFDVGAGSAFGSGCGRLARGLAKIGIKPGDVKTIFVTHAHTDHICGLVDAANKPLFHSARIVAAKTEVDFWTGDSPDLSGMRTPPETAAQLAFGVKKTLMAVRPNLELRTPGRLMPEVELIAAPGHTPGHSMFRVSSGNDTLLVIGDSVHVHSLQFPHPEWTMCYDVNSPLAIKTRLKLFKDAAADRTTLLGFHMPFPGIGHVRASGQGFEWVPKPWVA